MILSREKLGLVERLVRTGARSLANVEASEHPVDERLPYRRSDLRLLLLELDPASDRLGRSRKVSVLNLPTLRLVPFILAPQSRREPLAN